MQQRYVVPLCYSHKSVHYLFTIFDIHMHFVVKINHNFFQQQVYITCKLENCGKQFTSAYNYQLHVKHHQQQFLFACQICGKGFMNKNHHESHSYTHLKEKPFPCKICAKRFLTRSNLHRHMLTCKTIIKKHECVTCGKKFMTDNNLKRHQIGSTSSSSLAATGAEELTDSHRRRFHPSRSLAETVYLLVCLKVRDRIVDY